jgi:hypothetical protein
MSPLLGTVMPVTWYTAYWDRLMQLYPGALHPAAWVGPLIPPPPLQ